MYTSEAIAYTNGIEIAYDTFGDRACPPVVLIMGLSSQMIMWEDEFCMKLARKGFWVVRFDNRDVGRSTRLDMLGIPDIRELFKGNPLAAIYGLQDMARDTAGLLDTLGIASAHIVGASMGGMIAQVIGLDYPERVRTLTVIMSTTGNPLLPPPRPEAVRFLYKPFPTNRDQYTEHFIEMWRVLSGNDQPMDEKHLRTLAGKTFDRGISPAGSARQLAAVVSSGSRKERLASVKAPTLVIHGEDDPLLQVQCGIDVAESIPGSRLMIIKGMGHSLPPSVWGEIIDAIARHAGASGEHSRKEIPGRQ